MDPRNDFGSRREISGLLALGAFTLVAIFGYGFFALRPQNLAGVPLAAEFFPISYRFFAQIHILLCFVALAIVLISRTGGRWIPALAAVYALSFLSEHMGTGYGIPFGGYEYTTLLGPRVGPRVPILIPLSWFLMSVPSWVIARSAFPHHRLARIGLAALGLVLWDLALDPAMSSLTSYWLWSEHGPYYGMPWMNLAGWYATGLVLMTVIDLLSDSAGFAHLPLGWMTAYWWVVLAMPLGMLAAAGSWLGVFVTLGAIAATVAVVSPMSRWASGVRPTEPEGLTDDPSSSSATTTPVRI